MSVDSAPRTALGLVDDAIAAVRGRADALVLLGLIGGGASTGLLLVAGAVGGGAAVAAAAVPSVVALVLTGTASVRCAAPTAGGAGIGVGDAVRATWRTLPSLLAFTLLGGALVGLGLLGLLVLALPIAAAVAMGWVAMVLEGCGPGEAITRGFRISLRHRGRIVGAVLVALGLTAALAAIGAQAGWLVAALGDGGTAAAVLVLTALVVAAAGFGLPVVVAVLVAAYVDCRVRNEGLDLLVDLRDLAPVTP